MKNLASALVILALALVFVAIASLVSGQASTPSFQSTTLKVVERATTDTWVHNTEADKDAIGDVLGFANEVYDETNTNKVGSDNGQCVRTAVGAAWECIWTITLDGGQLTVEGPFYDTADSVLAITGGTGDYMGARGQMTLHARNAQGREYDFTYQIVNQ